ncbi:HAD-IIB family hydrolase [Propioniciclava soli]|uniref:HAD family hydrolase n=1 Tax=Propioniciclava soli TaxID=2775081 RepID=A0ABZ3CDB5_9ACTN|nr:HAD family hydrolase [Propioniciclava soli]
MLVTDLDGTIVFDRAVPPATRAALDRWRAAGHVLVVATGKSIFATDDVLGPSGVTFDHCVCFTGAVITDAGYRVEDARFLPPDLVHAVYADLRDAPHVATFATTLADDHLLADNAGRVDSILARYTPLAEEDLARHEFVGIPLLVTDDTARDQVAAHLVATWGDRIALHRNQDFLDIVPPGSDKGSGLRRLLGRRFAGEPVEVWTLGDSWNDIAMHTVADHPVCFSYSPDEVKAVCEREVARAEDLIDDLLGG